LNHALVILGMHRSGTSSVAGALAQLGAKAPSTLMPGHPDNPKGYWESEVLTKLSEDVLESGGSSWSDWRPFNPSWTKSKAAKALSLSIVAALRAEFESAPLIVLKDPRLCRIFPVWSAALKAANYEPRIMIPLRSPVEVAASLSARDGFSQAHGLLIWLRNVLEAEVSSRGFPRYFFRWSDFIQDWRTELDRATNLLGVTLPGRSDLGDSRVDAFLDRRLQRQVASGGLPSNSPAWIAQAEDALAALLLDPGDTAAQDALDAVRSEFDATACLVGPAFVEIEFEQAHRNAELRNQVVALNAQIVALNADLAEARGQRDHLANERSGNLAALSTAHVELAQMKMRLDSGLARNEELQCDLDGAREQLQLMGDEIAGVHRQRAELSAQRIDTENQLHVARAELVETQGRLEELNLRNHDLSVELDEQKMVSLDLKSNIDLLTHERDQSAYENRKIGDEFEAMKSKWNEREDFLNHEIETLTVAHAALCVELESVNTDRSDLDALLQLTESELAVVTDRLHRADAEMQGLLAEHRAHPVRSAITLLARALDSKQSSESALPIHK